MHAKLPFYFILYVYYSLYNMSTSTIIPMSTIREMRIPLEMKELTPIELSSVTKTYHWVLSYMILWTMHHKGGQGWRQEFSDGWLTLVTRGLKWSFPGTINTKSQKDCFSSSSVLLFIHEYRRWGLCLYPSFGATPLGGFLLPFFLFLTACMGLAEPCTFIETVFSFYSNF